VTDCVGFRVQFVGLEVTDVEFDLLDKIRYAVSSCNHVLAPPPPRTIDRRTEISNVVDFCYFISTRREAIGVPTTLCKQKLFQQNDCMGFIKEQPSCSVIFRRPQSWKLAVQCSKRSNHDAYLPTQCSL
jgi:hypothetical protein